MQAARTTNLALKFGLAVVALIAAGSPAAAAVSRVLVLIDAALGQLEA